MNILIDVGHPAHVHLFRNFAIEMQSKKHKILFTCRDKEFEIYLLEHYRLPYKSFGRKYLSLPGKMLGLIEFDIKEFITGLRFRPDIFLSHGSIYAAHASALLGRPHISLEDTFNFEQIRLYKPFTNAILTSDYDHPFNSKKLIKYSGYHELAYLHPKRFQPDVTVLKELGVQKDEKYTIVRFVSWKASHDIGHKGIIPENKLKAINSFKKNGKVYISSESELPDLLKPYQLKIPPHRIHDQLLLHHYYSEKVQQWLKKQQCWGLLLFISSTIVPVIQSILKINISLCLIFLSQRKIRLRLLKLDKNY